MTCPTTACYNGLPLGEKTISVGGRLRYFGDGWQISKKIGGRRYWRIPVMDGEFLCEETFGTVKGVAGGNIIVMGTEPAATLAAAEAAVAAMRRVPRRDPAVPRRHRSLGLQGRQQVQEPPGQHQHGLRPDAPRRRRHRDAAGRPLCLRDRDRRPEPRGGRAGHGGRRADRRRRRQASSPSPRATTAATSDRTTSACSMSSNVMRHDRIDRRKQEHDDDVSTNRAASRWSNVSLVRAAEDRRIAVHPIEGGGRYIDCGIEARGGLLTGVELARICLAGLADGRDRARRGRGPTDHDGPGRHRSSGPGVPGQPVRGLGDQGGEVLRDGLGPDAGRRRHRGDLRRRSDTARRPTSVVGVLETRKPPPAAVVAEDRRGLPGRAVGGHAARRADRQPGRRRADRGPIGRDRPAQAGRAQVRPLAASSRPTARPPCPRSPPTTSPRSAAPTTPSCTAHA